MKLRDFFQNRAWRKWEKSQWSILLLTGALLMVIAIPTGGKKQAQTDEPAKEELDLQTAKEEHNYAREVEKKLKGVLSRIEGAGRVEVMVTLEDFGESVVEKDVKSESSDLQESDGTGGIRTEKSSVTDRQTVYQGENSEKAPFVGKEKLPKVAGVLVVAHGGENTVVKQNISDAVMALFQIDVNRIKVVKMNIQEEGY